MTMRSKITATPTPTKKVTKLSKNIIAFRRNGIVVPEGHVNERIAASTLNYKLIQLGYILSEQAFEAVASAHLSWITEFSNEIEPWLRGQLGGDREYSALYKNFPQEVMSLTDSELIYNAIRHYWSNGTWEPSTLEGLSRPHVFEDIKYTEIKLFSESDFDSIFTKLTGGNQSLTPTDLETIKWFATSGRELKFPEQIPFKENLCTLAAMKLPGLPVKTTTDVLRIAVSMSGGNISLPALPPKMIALNRWSRTKSKNPEREKFKFKKFNRAERRYLLELLENSNCSTSEMVLRAGRWKRLGEILHPGEYKDRFPKAFAAFKAIRNGEAKSWYSQLDKHFNISFDAGLSTLSKRPGEFVRRIDSLVRNNQSKIDVIIAAFGNTAAQASNKVLYEVYTHFQGRREVKLNRSIRIKGARKAIKLPTLPALPEGIINRIEGAVFDSLLNKFALLEPMGKVYLDPKLKDIPLPTDMRSVSESLKPIIRGTAVPFENPELKVIRPFVHWYDSHGHEDIDLSASFFGPMGREILSYSHLRVGVSCHSGDVRGRQGNCAEYIDIQIEDALSRGFEYVVIDIRNYNGRALSTLDVKFGFMEREHPESNKLWLPDTVKNTFTFDSQSAVVIAVMLDLKNRTYVIIDEDSNGSPFATGDVNTIKEMLEKYSRPPKFSVYDLLEMHVLARGEMATLNSPQIDQQFLAEDFMYSYEKTLEYMGV